MTRSRLSEDEMPTEAVMRRVTIPMLDIMDKLMADVHRLDPEGGHHNHHLCIHVREWHDLLGVDDEMIQTTLMSFLPEIVREKLLDTASRPIVQSL